MNGQPATKVKWNGNYIFGNTQFAAFPEHSAEIAAVIAGWSIVEASLGRAFATLIGAKQPVAMTMYSAARSFEVQRALLEAAVDDVLAPRVALLFKIVLVVIYRAAAHRHRFAHWVWGASTDPDFTALLLVEPKHYWTLTAKQLRYWGRNRSNPDLFFFPEDIRNIAREHVLTLRLDDLKRARAEIERAYKLADALREFVGETGARRRAIRKWLEADSEIQKALEKAKKSLRPKP